MPYIKVLRKRKFKKHYVDRTVETLKYLLAIMLFSLAAGGAALYVSDAVNNEISSSKGIEEEIKDKLVKQFVEESKTSGDDWKSGIDEQTKRELKEKYGYLLKH